MKKILLLLLLPILSFSQSSWVNFKVQFDFYAPSESNFFMVSDASGDTTMFFQPTTSYQYLDTTITINSGQYLLSLIDNYGDGWVSSQPAWFKMSNDCQGSIVDYTPLTQAFFTLDTLVNIWPCAPPVLPYCEEATLSLNLDQFPSETTWEIKDTNGTVIESGGPYSTQYQQLQIPVCLPLAPLSFIINDTYGDGIAGSLWGGQDGSYLITQCYDTLVYCTDPNFGINAIHSFVSDSCVPIFGCMDTLYIEYNPLADTSAGSECVDLIVYGCIDSTMYNYDASANSMALIPNCDYTLTLYDLMGNGWVDSYLQVIQGNDTNQYILTTGFQQNFTINLNAPQPVSFKFFITQQAQGTAAHCGFKLTNPLGDSIIEIAAPFLLPLSKHTTNTYCGDLCVEKVFGCPDDLACNYVSGVNTPTLCTYPVTYYNCNNECISDIDGDGVCDELEIVGCQDPLMYNYNMLATDSGACEQFIYGCTDPLMFNYDLTANTDNGNCEPYVYGCTDSTMFNYNPLANADNNSCVLFVYGCTDPSMLNYDAVANTEDFSCIPFVYGCMDSIALNYDSLANTDNESCITVVEGCMDQSAYNYDVIANVHDSVSCLYNANCITGPGNPYWLNDPCYAWVISVDDYCCENEWDNICQLTYNYCDGTYIGPLLTRVQAKKELIMITDLLGRETKEIKNQLLFYIYNDGSVEKKTIKQK